MNFGSDPDLEAMIGRVCLVFARVEQEAGHLLASANRLRTLVGESDRCVPVTAPIAVAGSRYGVGPGNRVNGGGMTHDL